MTHSPFSENIKVSSSGAFGWSDAVGAVWLISVQLWIQNNGNSCCREKWHFQVIKIPLEKESLHEKIVSWTNECQFRPKSTFNLIDKVGSSCKLVLSFVILIPTWNENLDLTALDPIGPNHEPFSLFDLSPAQRRLASHQTSTIHSRHLPIGARTTGNACKRAR